jgi:hypothetical protein
VGPARPHGGIPSPGAEQRSERPFTGFWPRICVYVVKKGHARDIYFLLPRNFWRFSAPSSLFTCCYLLATRQCLSLAVLAPLTCNFDPVVLPIEGVCVGIV